MTLATKNGSLITKDGKLGTDCACCGGWYCDSVTCWCCDLTTFLPSCRVITIPGDSCQTDFNVKQMDGRIPCATTEVTARMSGWVAGQCSSGLSPLGYAVTEADKFNTSVVFQELCGGGGASKAFAADGVLFLGGSMLIAAGFSNQQLNGGSCANRFVSFQVKVRTLLQYGTGFNTTSIRYSGDYESSCFSIDSLSPGGKWLAGRTVSVACTGQADITLGYEVVCPLATQNVTVSFE